MSHTLQDNPHFTITTYNIHRCIGRDGIQSPQRIAAVVNETRPSVVGLQEVDSRDGLAHEHQLDYLAMATGMQGIAGPVTVRDDGHYGNALLTTERVREVRRHDLSVPGREPRGALDVDLEKDGCVLRVLVAHLGLRPTERREQVTRLLAILDQHPDVPTLLMGDFNEWLWWGRPLRWLAGRMGSPFLRPTFPAGLPLLSLDKVWASPQHMLDGLQVHRSPMARIASDHLPVTALCRIPVHEEARAALPLSCAVAIGI